MVRPAMLYGLATEEKTGGRARGSRDKKKKKKLEIKMLRLSLGVTRMDRIRNEYIRETAHERPFGDNAREARLSCS